MINKYRVLMSNILLFVVCLLLGECAQKRQPHSEIVLEFLHKLKSEEYSEATLMLSEGARNDKWYNERNFVKIHDLLLRYDIPETEKWSIDYDTAFMVKRKMYSIPLFKGYDTANLLQKAVITIDFEYGGSHIGDYIMIYEVSTFYDR